MNPGSESSPGEEIGYPLQYSWPSLVAQKIKNLPAMWETWVQFLGWEDPLKEGMDRGAWRAIQFMGSQRVGHD